MSMRGFSFIQSPEIAPDVLDEGIDSMRNSNDKGLRGMDLGEEDPLSEKQQREEGCCTSYFSPILLLMQGSIKWQWIAGRPCGASLG
ncbi:hypothetical protein FQN60_008152 [Etheostoma spectabile]|uniref:Uncharacterized protein n=1 Tax=Etheostoma spectabile TaxID=54343 RepID=A0A5J5CRE9_9PERO|nr:hypothetical protein FQN60_008152 [Etheostoma spectabile]